MQDHPEYPLDPSPTAEPTKEEVEKRRQELINLMVGAPLPNRAQRRSAPRDEQRERELYEYEQRIRDLRRLK